MCETKITGTGVTITEQIFGALSQDSENPLSRVSVANSSFSLDPFRGCPARCSYCTVAGASRDIIIVRDKKDDKFRVQLPSKPEMLFSGYQLAEALIRHPAFIKDRSVISIGTGSTEAFLPEVERETWNIMEAMLKEGYKNPFWIATKMSIPDQFAQTWSDRFLRLTQNGIRVLLSVTHSGAPSWVEPYQGNRFRNMELMKSSGAHISLHLRPIIRGVNDSRDCLAKALDTSMPIAEAVCVGGLRNDSGVGIAWKVVYKLSPSLLPPTTNREKTIPDGYVERVREYLVQRGWATVPIFTKSSEVISKLLGLPEYNLYKYRPDDTKCFLSIPRAVQNKVRLAYGMSVADLIKSTSKTIGLIGISAKLDGEEITLNRDLSYQEHRALIHAIGHTGVLDEFE